MAQTIEGSLRLLLENHRYVSSMTGKDKGLMTHHINALMTDLLLWLEARGIDPKEHCDAYVGQNP